MKPEAVMLFFCSRFAGVLSYTEVGACFVTYVSAAKLEVGPSLFLVGGWGEVLFFCFFLVFFYPSMSLNASRPLQLSSVAAGEPLNRGRLLKGAGRPPACSYEPVSMTLKAFK